MDPSIWICRLCLFNLKTMIRPCLIDNIKVMHFSDLLSISLQEVLAEVPLTWSLAGPLISRTKSTWSKAFSEHRCWGQAKVLVGSTTRSASCCSS